MDRDDELEMVEEEKRAWLKPSADDNLGHARTDIAEN